MQEDERTASVLWRWLLDGPDPVEDDEPIGTMEALLPWPIRCAAVFSAALASWWWKDTGVGQQIAWALQVGALSLLAIIASYWWQIALVDGALACVWFIPFRERAKGPNRWTILQAITFANRQVGHIKALAIWLLVAWGTSAKLPWQIGGAAAVFLIGPPLVNGLARSSFSVLGDDHPRKSTGDLLWRRRILIYAASVLGLVVLALEAPSQVERLLPLIAAVSVGLVLRIARHGHRNRKVRKEAGDSSMSRARADFRKQQSTVAQATDPFGPLLVLAGLGLLIGLSWWQRRKLEDDLGAKLDSAPLPTDSCGRDPLGPVSADIELFLLADTQMHELAGERFPGQAEVAEAFVRTASRPVALDMLSIVPVLHFATIYRQLVADRDKERRARPLWVHLGDLADLACSGEIDRMTTLLRPFATSGPAAGIAMGNHDATFIGSLHWSPYWDTSCVSGRLDKDKAVKTMATLLASSDHGQRREVVTLESSAFYPRGGVLATVTKLGVSQHREHERGVIGVFLDTSDGRAFDEGNPGSVGAISGAQLRQVEAAIHRLRNEERGPYRDDPAYVLFSHIPFGELEGTSRERLADFIERLDERGPKRVADPRVLSLVAGHTHVAGGHRHCVGNRVLREIVVGSTTDPPQQAAIVEIGSDVKGRLALGVRTVQAVARPGVTCEKAEVKARPREATEAKAKPIDAAACRAVARDLMTKPACAPLWATRSNDLPPRDCQQVEEARTLVQQLTALREYQGPRSPAQRRQLQETEASQLLRCICRDDDCPPGTVDDPFDGERYATALREIYAKPERTQEMVCFAWAASACQAHKAMNMNMGEAFRCAFDDSTLPSERVTVANLEAVTCY